MKSQRSGARRRSASAIALCAVVSTTLLSLHATAQAPAPVVGNATRGAPLFADKYNCYACHGFDGQTGERRLIPLNYTQEGFITFVQNSPLPQMPAFPDAPAQDLADIYAYVRSIPADAPSVEDVPLLKDILERQQAQFAD
jgi:mono/diheme cytochrome c family protein